MTEQDDKLFRFAPLTDYSVREQISIRLADLLFYFCIRLLGSTTRFDVRGVENLDSVTQAGRSPILCFWHDRIFLATYYFRDRSIVVMTSESFDGEYIARFIQRFGFGAIRGSSSRGGTRALVEMIKATRKEYPMGFAVDGPRGPRYEVKPGPVILAKKTGNPIVPFLIETKHRWTVNSWDRMQIPKPFTRAITIVGEPIYVDPDADDAAVERKLLDIQTALDELTRQGQQWRDQK